MSYEQRDIEGADDEGQYFYAAGTFNVTPTIKLAGAYGQVDDMGQGTGVSRDLDGEGYSLGVFYNILPKTTLSLAYSDLEMDNDSERQMYGVGVVQTF